MLNSVLTVKRDAPDHQGKGWELLPMAFRSHLRRRCWYSVMGGTGAAKGAHLIPAIAVGAPHPHHYLLTGDSWVGHFSAANRFLMEHHRGPVDWRVLRDSALPIATATWGSQDNGRGRRLGYQFDEQMGIILGKWVESATHGLVAVINQNFTG